MKTAIATVLILSAGIAQAHSFDYEKQIGTTELFATLATEGVMSAETGRNFDYQIAVGTPELFPTLISDGAPSTSASGERTVFEYQLNIGTDELDPSLS